MYDELGEDGKRAHTVTAIAKAREPSAGRTFCRRRGHSHRPRQEQRVVTSTPVTGPRCSLQHHLRQLLEQPVRPPQLITAGAGLTHQLGHRGGLLLFQSGPARPPFGRSTPRPRPLLYRIIRGARARTTSGHVMKFHAPTLQLRQPRGSPEMACRGGTEIPKLQQSPPGQARGFYSPLWRAPR